MTPPDDTITPRLPCLLNDEDCALRTREAVREMVFAVWDHALSSLGAARSTEKQRLINIGMEKVIKTALGDYAKEIFLSTRARLVVEMRDGNRIKDAYKRGAETSLSPDSSIIPNYAGSGHHFILMYKMNMSSLNKNAQNAVMNMSGEMTEFHRHPGNADRYMVIMNATPKTNFRPVGKKGMIVPEETVKIDHSERYEVGPAEGPGTLGYKMATQSIITDIRFDWHPDIKAAIVSKASLAAAIKEKGREAVRLDGMDLIGLDLLVRRVVQSYDPLLEFRPLDTEAFPETQDADEEFEFPF